ncbi:DUF881 domain-containing protein [Bacillus kexueae]|uniref:DUF881 domain-containing protein n=1 Tax=Aeribacillus kexueae TaxID=2078952 RepID=UPI001FB002ED|nr:DUF881 domain-containing protein [Bacillus kexueae]
MLSVQYKSIQEPVVRDTRDIWELRTDLKEQQQIQIDLLEQIRKYEQIVESYKQEQADSAEATLRDTLDELKKQAGLTEVTGPGVILTIEPLFELDLAGHSTYQLSPQLLIRTINELNSYGAEHISINDHRVINTTVIRDINGTTKIDGYNLNRFPITIQIIADDAEKLYNRIHASTLKDDFAIDSLNLSVTRPEQMVVVPAYEDTIRVKHMEPLNLEKEGNT